MKNWLLPIAVLGVSGIGLLFASERGRTQVHNLFDRLADVPDPFGPFNQALERELEYIQQTLDQLSEALEA
ncbi:MAG TPA: hypothetical protein VKE71_14480 [Candidatus Angelobacter sp.]|nr:hypothetical protein [Candidatus Angelobacter sp.]